MTQNPTRPEGDLTPITGGIALPSNLIDTSDADDTAAADDTAPTDDLGREAYTLMKLHPGAVSLKFRDCDLSRMDDATKRTLIADIHHALGSAPLKCDVL